jgi:hypothetical protein
MVIANNESSVMSVAKGKVMGEMVEGGNSVKAGEFRRRRYWRCLIMHPSGRSLESCHFGISHNPGGPSWAMRANVRRYGVVLYGTRTVRILVSQE